ncbi:MAG: hypothetical protein SFY69_07740 [Planctomycetota bacterium]|nr:hypothetical protein [Planctomycetota bacterium]
MQARRSRGGVWVMVGVGLLAASVGGCGKPLLSENEPRSQYDRNDAARDRRAPTYVWDQKGNRLPNVRGRLLGAQE